MAEVLHVNSACFSIACLGHLYGNMLISISAGNIVQLKSYRLDSIMTIGKSLSFLSAEFSVIFSL